MDALQRTQRKLEEWYNSPAGIVASLHDAGASDQEIHEAFAYEGLVLPQ